MKIYYCEHTVFKYDGEEWMIINVDCEDDEYPYECYPVRIVQEAKRITEDDDYYEDILDEKFIDERICFSDHDIQEYIYEEEIKTLKARIKELEGDLNGTTI